MVGEIRTKRWNEPVEKADGTRIFVARYRPRYLRKGDEPWDERLVELAPSKELHAAWCGKRGQKQISYSDYTRRFRQEMRAQVASIRELARRVLNCETVTLLCFCKDASRCHRTLLKSMVEQAAGKLGEEG